EGRDTIIGSSNSYWVDTGALGFRRGPLEKAIGRIDACSRRVAGVKGIGKGLNGNISVSRRGGERQKAEFVHRLVAQSGKGGSGEGQQGLFVDRCTGNGR